MKQVSLEDFDAAAKQAVKSIRTTGPGTELKNILKKIGIIAKPNCSCNARARIMDQKGCNWCAANIDLIIEWLKEESIKRKLPFIKIISKCIIYYAIYLARKKERAMNV